MRYPEFHNAPVPAFGSLDAELLIVGLAPGLKGANATGRPFTGDYAGDILYPALLKHGFASGKFEKHADDSLKLHNCRITNAVRCVPPQNKPENDEIRQCNQFLRDEIAAMKKLRIILSLGSISHQGVLRAYGLKLSAAKFAHGAHHEIPLSSGQTLVLADTYHTSRYNINTGVLTPEMFDEVIVSIKNKLNYRAS